jgi:probable DNA metabolism protein
MDNDGQGDLFCDSDGDAKDSCGTETAGIKIIACVYSSYGINLSALPPNTRRLFEVSAEAFNIVVHAWMSEFPIAAEITRFEEKVLAADTAGAAGKITTDRGDADVRTVLEAAEKAMHEIHRLMGLLRFNPDEHGVYIAYCATDHFILPALGSHFKERFGQTPWAIIDEKRHLCLSCPQGEQWTMDKSPDAGTEKPLGGNWEKLWQHYHKTINNESRNNPKLQRQLMPQRYWKYLTELGSSENSLK